MAEHPSGAGIALKEIDVSLTIDPWSFPAAEFDPKGEGKRSIMLGGG